MSNIINNYKLRFDNMNIEYEILEDVIYRISDPYKQKANIIYYKDIDNSDNNSSFNSKLYQFSLNIIIM